VPVGVATGKVPWKYRKDLKPRDSSDAKFSLASSVLKVVQSRASDLQ
jgi:hypothetical protein